MDKTSDRKIYRASVCTNPEPGFKSFEFNHAFSPASGSFDDIQKLILKHWSPVVFKNSHRKGSNFISCDLMALDIDGGYTISQAYDDFQDHACIIGITKSHQKSKGNAPPCDRFRIVCPFEKAITNPAHYKQIISRWVDRCHGDRARTDLAPYFAPCLEVVWVNNGETIKVPDFVFTKEKHLPRPTEVKPRPSQAIQTLYSGAASGTAGTGRWAVLGSALVALWRQGYSDSEIASIAAPFTDYSVREIERYVKWINENIPKGDMVNGEKK